MPNWCENTLRVHAPAKVLNRAATKDEIFATLAGTSSNEFRHLMQAYDPTPKTVFQRGTDDDSSLPGWYRWNIVHYGTQWDVDGCAHGGNPPGASFDSAWSPAHRIAVQIINALVGAVPPGSRDLDDVAVTLEFLELGNDFAGTYTLQGPCDRPNDTLVEWSPIDALIAAAEDHGDDLDRDDLFERYLEGRYGDLDLADESTIPDHFKNEPALDGDVPERQLAAEAIADAYDLGDIVEICAEACNHSVAYLDAARRHSPQAAVVAEAAWNTIDGDLLRDVFSRPVIAEIASMTGAEADVARRRLMARRQQQPRDLFEVVRRSLYR